MDTKALRQKVLDLAIRGKLVPQDPNDEPASVLLERIRHQKQQILPPQLFQFPQIDPAKKIFSFQAHCFLQGFVTPFKC